jgi:RAB protein geranylgeranyltransferase component A
VGNWWIYQPQKDEDKTLTSDGKLSRIPNGREDVFADKSIDLRAKRNLMKFLKFVVDHENQLDVWEHQGTSPLPDFLASQFQIPAGLQTVVMALTLSLEMPENTTVAYSLPRIARHLTSIGVFGPGFGAVLPKWGGGAEIAQVACRAGAVGGGIYVLGAGIEKFEGEAVNEAGNVEFILTNGEKITTRLLLASPDGVPTTGSSQTASLGSVAKMLCIVASPLSSLFTSNVEGGPVAAISVVVFPPHSLVIDDEPQSHPIYLMVHSSETGECPKDQCEYQCFILSALRISQHYMMIQLTNTYLHCLKLLKITTSDSLMMH